MDNKHPTIEEVIRQEDGQWIIIKSVDSFKDQHLPKRKLELFEIRQHIINELKEGRAPYICSCCKIPVKISGGAPGEGTQSLHFRHAQRNSNCIYNDPSKYTREQILCMKFNGAKEGYKHEYLKNTIASILNEDMNYLPLKVEVEKVVRSQQVSKEWRKPDIRAIYPDKKIVFELQIASTFVDVILERSSFYKQEKSYLIWVLDEFSTDLKEQTFSQTDILVSSNYNVFVFDKEMEELSTKSNRLHLKCNYVYHTVQRDKLSPPLWGIEIITLQQIHYDKKYRVYFYNTEGKKEELLEEIENKTQIAEDQSAIDITDYHPAQYYFQRKRNIQIEDLRLINEIRSCEEKNEYGKIEAAFRRMDDYDLGSFSFLIQDLITDYYFNSKSFYFLCFIFQEYRLHIDLNQLNDEKFGYSPLRTLLVRGFEQNVFYNLLQSFFVRGYIPEEEDKITISSYIRESLEKNLSVDTDLLILERYSIALQYIRLFESELKCFNILYNYRTKHFILRVLSVLINQIIGTKQKSFSAIVNDIIVNNLEYSHLFIIAMQSARGKKNDYGKNGTKLLVRFDKSKINHDLDDVFQAIFPNIPWKEKIETLLN
ncbi:DUF6035 family protein [Dysgonomonas macrotermitis]|uniref:Competence protein CoiA-like family protein n=1 Tax=Dysgonomonas macrotermitis TaxID=1346286 RepID=A0A1M4W5A5_9BACT|nr:DUF6035 family protein [Dysgonomonas macrotermitis]SHE76387.1 hypothetical protein SAMN05444362_102130 [Dysgonomonas macrotermitis]